MPTKDEQETTVTQLRDDVTRIYTANPVHLRKLRKDDRAVEIRGGDDWGQFEIAASDFSPITGFKTRRKPLTEAEREIRRARFQQNVLSK